MVLYSITYILLLLSPALSRHLPRYADMDEDEQQLYRAAYETPSYDSDEYQEDGDASMGKLDLLKDALWAIKAKVKELKVFNKALAANLLSTKLKLKELIASGLLLKKHVHGEVAEKKKPTYNYQPPSYPQYDPYAAPQYGHDPYYGH
ncbi:unnamed protein product [Parnassius apollo]|uniref:(apollo) hypothetical protein n=1 Tax=Parnassius apollo TaxID=110799 RepID=A0A8S3WSZ7_PARAO|nr:unnamed protein product [Parnassius apollo]